MNATVEIDSSSRRRNAFLTSVGLHGLLVALLILFKIVTPIPPFEPGGGPGMELGIADLGYSDEGMGNEEVMDAGAESAPAESSPAETAEEELIAEEDGEEISKPPTTDAKKPTDPTPKPKPKEPVIKEPTVNRDALFSPSSGSSTSSQTGQGGDGNSNTPSNVGVPGGDPGGSGVFGGGVGSWKLGGRGLGRGPNISEKPSKAGKVVLTIWVDPKGVVTRAEQNTGKSTTLDAELVSIAKKAARQCTFTPKPDAPAEQVGEMTFVFILE